MKKLQHLINHGLVVSLITLLAATSTPAIADEPFLGEMRWFAGSFAPRGWALCDGQILQISQNTALFSLLGTTYGGDGRTTFGLPDMRGRFMAAAGQGPGLTNRPQGASYGTETTTITTAQMATHSHTLRADSDVGSDTSPVNSVKAAVRRGYASAGSADVTMHPSTITFTGQGREVDNMPPAVGLNCIIALQGIFPSRN